MISMVQRLRLWKKSIFSWEKALTAGKLLSFDFHDVNNMEQTL